LQRLQELDAGHLRHVPVREDHVGLLAADEAERLPAVAGLDDVSARVGARAGQRALDDHAHGLAVVDDEDLHGSVPFRCFSGVRGGRAGSERRSSSVTTTSSPSLRQDGALHDLAAGDGHAVVTTAVTDGRDSWQVPRAWT
jgi:hypothetical protein